MATSIPSLLGLLVSALALYSAPTAESNSSSNQVQEAFVECLLNRTDPSHPVSVAIYTPDNATFLSVVQAYIRDLRYETSDTPKPFLILTALHESHLQSAVICAQVNNLPMKIRSGGHDYEGVSYTSHDDVPFFVLDMFNLRSIDIDMESETAWVGAGASLGELYYTIQEKSKVHGFPGGVCPTVGVGGHMSGGGYGNMIRKHGLTIDHVADAKMVDVRGRVLDRASMGEDVFWAISGGGASSYGVVLSYKINLPRVPENVTVFEVARTVADDNATDIVLKWEQVAPFLPDDLFIRLNLDVVTTPDAQKTVRASFVALYLGDPTSLLLIMNRFFPELGLTRPDCIETGWVQSALFWANIPITTPPEILLRRIPESLTFVKRKSDYVQTLIPRDGLEFIFEKLIELESVLMEFNPYGGKMALIPATATPMPHRAGNLWKIQYEATWDGAEATERNVEMMRKMYDYMTPYVSKNPRGAFFNYKDLDLGMNHNNGKSSYTEGMAYGIKYFKGNFERLVEIKTKVDPNNFFRNEQSIPTLPYGKR